MTQFKFGDMVIDKSGLLPGNCVVINTSEHTAQIMNERGDYNAGARLDDLELIPHPDTVRLDWLADSDNTTGNVQLPAECVHQNPDSLREAIDCAMQQHKAENES